MGDVWRPDGRFPCRSAKRWNLLIRKQAASVDRAAAVTDGKSLARCLHSAPQTVKKTFPRGLEGRRSATSIFAASADRAHRSFRSLANIGVLRADRAQPLYLLTPAGRFALRASAHRAHASLRAFGRSQRSRKMLRHKALGLCPKPRQGDDPPAPHTLSAA